MLHTTIVVLGVAHHLIDLLIACHALLQKNLVYHRKGKPLSGDVLKLLCIMCDAAARAAKRVCRTRDDGNRLPGQKPRLLDIEPAIQLRAIFSPMRSIVALNSSRFASLMDSSEVPKAR